MDTSCLLFLTLVSYQLLLLQLHYPVSAADDESTTAWYKPGCQQQIFNCGRFGKFKFPYTNETSEISYTCAPGRLDCSGEIPKLNLRYLYEVKRFSTEETVEVNYPPLTPLKRNNSCEIFNYNIGFWNSGAVSFTFTPNITLLKCYVPPPYNNTTIGIHSCGSYKIYYSPKKRVELLTDLQTLPPHCEIIRLPAAPDDARWGTSGSSSSSGDLFSLLASEFTIRFNVSTQCQDCINKGNRCSLLQPDFSCTTPDDKVNPQRSKLLLILGTGVSVGFLAVVLLIYCFLRYFHGKSIKFWNKQNKSHRDMEAILKNCKDLAPNRYSYADVRKITNSFSEKLGQGGYGEVFKGKLRNCTQVAVKILKETKGDGEEFINEVTSISRTSHVNIVPLLGYCYEGRKRALIYKFMPNGSLDKFLQDKITLGEPYLGQEKLYEISVGVAQGLEYLHRGCNTRILHLDIKPQNILLDEDFCPKISDFGLAKLCHKKESVVSLLDARGTVGYVAPEVFCRGYGGVSHKSDVYSYGMMILDMVGARKNTSDGVDKTSEIYFPDMIYKNLELVHPEIGADNESERTMMIVGLWCIQSEPSNRPAMGKVVEMLKGTIKPLPIPPRPTLSTLPRELAISTARDTLSSASVCLDSAL